MKGRILLKKLTAVGACILMLLPLIPRARAEGDSYSKTKNSGVRGEVCASLEGTGAEAYYEGGNGYAELSLLSESELLDRLRVLMTETHVYSATYADSKNYAHMTDCQRGEDGIVLLYTSAVVEPSDFIGSGSIGWNREHVWPKSLGGFNNTGAGSDLHHIRPDDVTTNAKRGNLKYGKVANGAEVCGSSLVSAAIGGSSGGGYFEPLDSVKGDVARICLYVYVRYGAELSKCSSITNVFESVEVLLEWCAEDPVDTWEMGRNEVVGAIQGNRNIFIDYPEYAFLLFGREVPADMVTPSGMAMSHGGSESTTEAESDETTEAEITSHPFTEGETEETEPQAVGSTETDADRSEEGGCGSSTALSLAVLLPAGAVYAALRKKRR